MKPYVSPEIKMVVFDLEEVLGPSGFDQDQETPAIPIDLF